MGGRIGVTVTPWGTRGSLSAPGPETARYGGNTSCVEVRADDGTLLVLDAGTGIRRLGVSLEDSPRMEDPPSRVDVLLTHLHMDHIQGLGFFGPLYDPDVEIHVWGPTSFTRPLRNRLTRYLSPPLFPVHLRSLPCRLFLHEVPRETLEVGPFRVRSAFVCHPGPTVGYRIESPDGIVAYLPDHEPALGVVDFPGDPAWTSGYALVAGADLLIHDAQYTDIEYATHVGWGHSAVSHVVAFAEMAGVKHVVLFHHDPVRSDEELDEIVAESAKRNSGSELRVSIAAEEKSYRLEGGVERVLA
ncbi:MAG TPA: MBL fold metallo-hydrolase [Gemmatimonadota bacterium]|nr:MBL fold metallo-hydrolase [Gemmatimonadota bacterium]